MRLRETNGSRRVVTKRRTKTGDRGMSHQRERRSRMGVARGNFKIIFALGLGLAGRAIVKRRRSFDLRGNVVLITGSSRGLGLALAEEFAQHGGNLVLCARDASELDAARKTVARHGTDVLTVPCDIADPDQV